MRQIIFTGDFLYNSEKHNKKYALWLFKILKPIIKASLCADVFITDEIVSDTNEIFSREKFYSLANQFNLKTCYNNYNPKDFNVEQINYLKKFFNNNSILVGIELYKPLCDLLSSFGCTVIDFAFHSYKLFDDLAFGIFTTNKEIHNKLLKYQIPSEKFYYYANYWKTFMEYNNMIPDDKLEDNSCVFIGQTLTDKSVEKDGIFLNIEHFETKINKLANKYSKVYYVPHPYLYKNCKKHFEYIKRNKNITLLNNCSTYGLLASDKIKKVIGISTSVLYEAQYFNKEIEYLYKPLFNIDVPFEAHSYISVYEDYWNPKFWAEILSPVCNVKNDIKDVNYFKGSSNKLRNIRDLYWGYKDLDPIKRMPNVEESIKRIYVKYLAKFL